MIYLLILSVALVSVLIAVPLTVFTIRWLEKASESPSPPSAPQPEPTPMTPERLNQMARRGSRR